MPEFENVRSTAEGIGRIMCIKTGREIGLLYRWDTGGTQAALYEDSPHKPQSLLERRNEADVLEDRSERQE